MVAFSIAMTLVAYLLVLGPATPAFHVAYLLLPGMSMFRFPTRFLIVVELGLAVLAAVGLTHLRSDLERRWKPPSRVPLLIVLGICAGTAVDLFVHQPRQNPMVPGREWLAPPAGVAVIRADTPQPRTFTPRHRDLHRRAFQVAHGWADVDPYFELRDVLEPNTGGGFWDTPSADCYAGIAPRWYVDVWGDHNRETSVVSLLAVPDFDARTLRVHPLLPKLLRTYGVTHLLSRYPQQGAALTFVSHDGSGYIYRIEGAARVRFVRAARRVASERDAVARLLSADFDPDREVLLHDSPESVRPTVAETGATAPNASPPPAAAVRRETSREIVIDANAPADGFLLFADTFYPGWTAQVDGTPTPIYRANLSVRAIQLPKGRHEIVFRYNAPGFYRGLGITLLAVGVLVIWTGGAAYAGRGVPR